MKRENWIVGDHGIRPAGELDKCFYCGRMRGKQHKDDCVIRSKTVVIEYTIRSVASVPEFWTQEDIEFHRNDSSWCCSNFIKEVVRRYKITEENDDLGCWCDVVSAKYIGEATEQDEEQWGMEFVDKLKS